MANDIIAKPTYEARLNGAIVATGESAQELADLNLINEEDLKQPENGIFEVFVRESGELHRESKVELSALPSTEAPAKKKTSKRAPSES